MGKCSVFIHNENGLFNIESLISSTLYIGMLLASGMLPVCVALLVVTATTSAQVSPLEEENMVVRDTDGLNRYVWPLSTFDFLRIEKASIT